MEYGKLIGAAYRISRGNWRLWPFGVFGGVGGGGNFNVSSDFGGDGDVDPDVVIAIVLVVVAVALVAAVMAVLSQGALVEGVVAAEHGERRRIRQGLRSGARWFWRVVGLYLLAALIGIAVLLVLAIVGGGTVAAVFALTDEVVLRVLAVVFAVLGALAVLFVALLPLMLIIQHAVRELVLGDQRPVASLKGGWRLFRANLGPSILVFLIQQGLVLAGYLVIGIVAGIVSIPAIVVLVATGGGVAGIVVAAVTAVLVIPAALAGAGAVGTFGHGLWTLGYLRMRSRETPAPA